MSAGWNAGASRPVVIQPNQYGHGGGIISSSEPGIKCCGCTFCGCLHFGFLNTKAGWLKCLELLFCGICMILLLRYGMTYSDILGFSFELFIITCSACLILVSVLLFSYLISAQSYSLIRQSVLEVVFNFLVAGLYTIASVLLSYTVERYLHKLYRETVHFSVYPAMSACYVLGFALGVIHLLDGILAWKKK